MIYILKHPQKDFSGFIHGVQFYKGIGSTSSELDRNALVKGGSKFPPIEDITSSYKKAAEPKPKPKAQPKPKGKPKGKPGGSSKRSKTVKNEQQEKGKETEKEATEAKAEEKK
jgi:hypothetical protein